MGINKLLAQCPFCKGLFGMPAQRHPIRVAIACPLCRARLRVTLGPARSQADLDARIPPEAPDDRRA